MGCGSSAAHPSADSAIENVDVNRADANEILESADKKPVVLDPQTQQALLKEAGFPKGVVVETDHPYAANPTSWQRMVQIEGSSGLCVYFASKTCTYDDDTWLAVYAGGFQQSLAGPGARVGVEVNGSGIVNGTLSVVQESGQRFSVLLDRKAAWGEPGPLHFAEDDPPEVEEEVEARYQNGVWYPAKVVDIVFYLDWYNSSRKPKFCVVSWHDGLTDDCEKTLEELRRPTNPREGLNEVETLARSVSRYSESARRGPCFASCAAKPKQVWVTYGEDQTPGDEIANFALDVTCLFSPIRIEQFAGAGPAQQRGVKAGWFLDLLGMEEQASSSESKSFFNILEDMYGSTIASKSTRKRTRHLIDAVFNNLEEFVQRLNDTVLSKSGVKLRFTNSSSKAKPNFLPEAWAAYTDSTVVGSEISQFKAAKESLQPASFICSGPAYSAGVRPDWLLDIDKTLSQNTGLQEAITKEELLQDPDKLLTMSDVTLVFKPTSLERSRFFEGAGPPAALALSGLRPLRPPIPNVGNDVWLTAGAKDLKQRYGKFYYEVLLNDICSTPQIGWVTDSFAEAEYNDNGVGDDEQGWGADGVRCKKWHNGSESAEWPMQWRRNDVVGCAISIEDSCMKFSLNGEWVEQAEMRFEPAGRSFYPCLSYMGAFTMHLTADTWRFAPPNEDYQPWASTGKYQRAASKQWKCPALPGDSALFEFSTDGAWAEQPEKRWGVWALVLPEDEAAPCMEDLDFLAKRWTEGVVAPCNN